MKKLMTAVAIVCAAAFAQAASLDWSVTGIQINGDFEQAEGDLAEGYYVALMDANGSYSQSKMVELIAAASTGSTEWKTALGSEISHFIGDSDGGGSVLGITGRPAEAPSGYMVILDADTIADAEHAFVTGVYTGTYASALTTGTLETYDFEGWVDATNPDGWKSVAAVPEPTSGLLLLLGVAGLALRRRRA